MHGYPVRFAKLHPETSLFRFPCLQSLINKAELLEGQAKYIVQSSTAASGCAMHPVRFLFQVLAILQSNSLAMSTVQMYLRVS